MDSSKISLAPLKVSSHTMRLTKTSGEEIWTHTWQERFSQADKKKEISILLYIRKLENNNKTILYIYIYKISINTILTKWSVEVLV